jgi:hypothetical protein
LNRAVCRAAAAGLAALVLSFAACSGDKPTAAAAPQDKAEALKQSAEQQREMYEKMRHNR